MHGDSQHGSAATAGADDNCRVPTRVSSWGKTFFLSLQPFTHDAAPASCAANCRLIPRNLRSDADPLWKALPQTSMLNRLGRGLRPMNSVGRASMAARSWSRRFSLTTLAILWLGACTHPDTAAQGAHIHRIVVSYPFVTIPGIGDDPHATQLAEQYCKSNGKAAQFKRMISRRLSRYASTRDAEFECVSRAPQALSQPS